MAVVKWYEGIDFVKGSLAKPVKKTGHTHGNYLFGTHRTAPTQNPNCNRVYVRGVNGFDRTGTPSANELWARTRFTEVAQAVKLRKSDLNSVNADNQAFLAQKDQPGGKKTMLAYLWKVCGENYDTAHPRS